MSKVNSITESSADTEVGLINGQLHRADGGGELLDTPNQDLTGLRVKSVEVGANESLLEENAEAALTADIPIRRPISEWYVRTHPEKTYWSSPLYAVLDPRDFGEYYLIGEGVTVTPKLQRAIKRVQLVAAVYVTPDDLA